MSDTAPGVTASGPQPNEAKAALEARNQWRVWEKSVARHATEPAFRLGLAASFTAESLVPFVGAELLQMGVSPAVWVAPYNQIFQVCLDPQAAFGADRSPDAIAILWRMEDLLTPELEAFASGDRTALPSALDKVDELCAAIRALRAAFPGILLVGVPPFPYLHHVDTHSLGPRSNLGHFHRKVLSHWHDLVDDLQGLHLLDLDAAQRDFGAGHSIDHRKWYLYKQPYTDAFLMHLAYQLGRLLQLLRKEPKKCLVLDCDNTLWGGVVGEEGVEGLQLGDEFPGKAYRDFQKLLLGWRHQGILLTILSKNNPADVWNVFDSHDGMVLTREHISAWRIDWNPKPENLPLIAAELNIGTDSLVFLDDSPFEIEQMRLARPEVTCVLLPEDPALLVETVKRSHLFDRLEITEEDRSRADMIAQERRRIELKDRITGPQFLQSLGLHLQVFEPRPEHLSRVTQLLNKTNQFNLTTLRRTQEEVKRLLDAGTFRLFAARVEDRFGDYGLTGLAIVQQVAPAVWYVDTFLLSCRVLGRDIETALLAFVAQEGAALGVRELQARFSPTRKNAPAANFLPGHGFRPSQDGLWTIECDKVPPRPPHIKVS